MESTLALMGLAVVAYAATHFDNLILLVGVVSRQGQPFAAVAIGVLLSTGAILALCIGAALVADLAPQHWLGYLGLVPIGFGVRELYRLKRADSDSETDSGIPAISAVGVAAVMLANSADTLGALVPIFAETRDALLPAVIVSVLVASGAACGLAWWIARHRHMGPAIRRLGPRLVPFVLIAVGLYVLSNTRTDTVLG